MIGQRLLEQGQLAGQADPDSIQIVGDEDQAAQGLEDLGLTSAEARVLVALLGLGSAGATQVAAAAGIHRPNVYPVLDALAARGLVGRLPGRGRIWAPARTEEVLESLYAAEQDRLERLEAKRPVLRGLLDSLGSTPTPDAPAAVTVVAGITETAKAYDALLASARDEVLVFNRPPYGQATFEPSVDVATLLGREVTIRVLYRAVDVEGPEVAEARVEVDAYVSMGVEVRTADDLPTKLAVIDRRAVLVAMMDPSSTEGRFPPSLHVVEAGFAASQGAVFDHYWHNSRPYEASGQVGA